MAFLGMLSALLQSGRPNGDGPPRILAYCASNVGMGHFCRLIRVLEAVKRQAAETSILLATDARETTLAAQVGVATVQMPRFRFIDQERFKEKPELLGIESAKLRELRAEMILSLGKSFQPHVLLMDSNPHGKRDEVLPLLRHMRDRRAGRALLMMRDIPSPPDEPFKLSGEPAQIRKHAAYYHRIMLAGDEHFFDAAGTYEWPRELRDKMTYLGFVVPSCAALSREQAFAACPQLDPALPTVLVSFGGGWQAERYAPPLIEGLEHYRRRKCSPLQMIMSTGLTIPQDHLEGLQNRAEQMGGVVIERFMPHFPQLLTHTDMAILQAGSAPFQALETDIPILLTHRPYKSREQEERARRLAQWPGIRLVEREDLTGEECAGWLEWGFTQRRIRRATGYGFDGIANAAREVLRAVELARA